MLQPDDALVKARTEIHAQLDRLKPAERERMLRWCVDELRLQSLGVMAAAIRIVIEDRRPRR